MCSLRLSLWEHRSGRLWCLALLSSSSCGPAAELQHPAPLLAGGWPSTEMLQHRRWALIPCAGDSSRRQVSLMLRAVYLQLCLLHLPTTKFLFYFAVQFELEKYLQCPLMKYFLWRYQGKEVVMSTFHDGINSHIIHASLDLFCKISIKPSRRICTFSILTIFNN